MYENKTLSQRQLLCLGLLICIEITEMKKMLMFYLCKIANKHISQSSENIIL